MALDEVSLNEIIDTVADSVEQDQTAKHDCHWQDKW